MSLACLSRIEKENITWKLYCLDAGQWWAKCPAIDTEYSDVTEEPWSGQLKKESSEGCISEDYQTPVFLVWSEC